MDDPCAITATTDHNVKVHVAAVFIIFVLSSLGVLFPLVAKYHPRLQIEHFWIILGKCAGTGVILACALVHMLQPANESLTSECVPTRFNTEYPAFAYAFAMIAILAMHLMEFLLTQKIEALHSKGDSNSPPCVDCENAAIEGQKLGTPADHVAEIERQQKLIAEAYIVEFGFTVHSLFIGLALGVESGSALTALLTALVFHQFFEGVSLGSRLADANLGVTNVVILILIFAISAPVGIAAGTIVYSSMNPNGETFLLVQGVFDSICGGLLLYVGFVFLLRDFQSDMQVHCKGKAWRYAAMFATTWIFAGLMALVGKYL